MHFLSQWVLTILLLVPLLGAAVLMVMRHRPTVVRRVALGTTLAACAVSLTIFVPFRWRQMLTYDDGPHGSVKLAQKAAFPPGSDHAFAADGLSVPFVVLTTLLFALLCASAWNDPVRGPGYFTTLLILEFSTLGTYVSFDYLLLVVMVALASAAAVALARMTAPGPSSRRLSVYLAVSLALLIFPLFAIKSAEGSLDLVLLANLARTTRVLPVWALIIAVLGFLIRAAAVPVHSWLVTITPQVQTPLAIVMNSVLPAAGAYGLMRAALPLSPNATGVWAGFAVLGTVGFIFAALCATATRDLRTFVAYSTASIAGCVLLAISLQVPIALDGAVMLLLGHALVSAMMIILANHPSAQSSGERPPLWTAFFAVTWIAWLVVPVLGGQIVIMLSGFEAARSTAALRVGNVAVPGAGYGLAIVALFGVLANGIASARIARRTFLPSTQSPAVQAPVESQPQDLAPIDIAILAVLGGVALLLGVLPGYLCFTFTHPATRALFHAD